MSQAAEAVAAPVVAKDRRRSDRVSANLVPLLRTSEAAEGVGDHDRR